jgi:hypothetical protein
MQAVSAFFGSSLAYESKPWHTSISNALLPWRTKHVYASLSVACRDGLCAPGFGPGQLLDVPKQLRSRLGAIANGQSHSSFT